MVYCALAHPSSSDASRLDSLFLRYRSLLRLALRLRQRARVKLLQLRQRLLHRRSDRHISRHAGSQMGRVAGLTLYDKYGGTCRCTRYLVA